MHAKKSLRVSRRHRLSACVATPVNHSRVSNGHFVWRRKRGVTDGANGRTRTDQLHCFGRFTHSLLAAPSFVCPLRPSGFSLLCRAVQCAFLRKVRPLALRCAIVRKALLQAGTRGRGLWHLLNRRFRLSLALSFPLILPPPPPRFCLRLSSSPAGARLGGKEVWQQWNQAKAAPVRRISPFLPPRHSIW